MLVRFCQFVLLTSSCILPWISTGEVTADRFRAPVRLQLDSDAESKSLWVFQSKTGFISRIDTENGILTGEFTSGGSAISDGRLTDSGILLCLDPDENVIRGLNKISKSASTVEGMSSVFTLPVPTDPVRMELNPSQTQLAIASRWSRTLSLWSLQSSTDTASEVVSVSKPLIEKQWQLHLDFAPGEMAFFEEEGVLFVADYFGGGITAVDLNRRQVRSRLELPANNIGDLYLDRSGSDPQLWITSESLNPIATTFSPEVQWGVMMGNHMRQISVRRLLEGTSESNANRLGEVASLGDETGPGGDPGRMAFTSSGKALVCLSGVARVALRDLSNRNYIPRVEVGDRPMDVVIMPDEKSAFVANYFSDNVVQIDLEYLEVVKEISLGPQPELDLVARGERLFFDATLSMRGWYSCNSCHTDGHTNGSLNDNLGDDSFGAPKKILSLLGVSHTAPYAWLGSQTDLDQQVAKTLKNTMLNRDIPEDRVNALVAYLHTLEPPPALLPAQSVVDENRVEKGRHVFNESKCNRCHKDPHFTTPKSYDVGLSDEAGNTEFNPPSLLGVSQKNNWLHNNSASSLEAVFQSYNHPKQKNWDPEDLNNLVYFLKTL